MLCFDNCDMYLLIITNEKLKKKVYYIFQNKLNQDMNVN
jgi:hypothetical protein